MRIGVLSLQGAFAEHLQVLHELEVEATEIRLPSQLENIDGLIIPGGESTTISKLMQSFDLMRPITEMARSGLPIMGTCAGMILLASDTCNHNVKTLEVMDIEVKRNAFGRQVDSFEVDLPVPVLGKKPFHAVFIRAPILAKVNSSAEVLASLPDGTPVAARQGNLLACAFHPELAQDPRFHRYFLDIAASGQDLLPRPRPE